MVSLALTSNLETWQKADDLLRNAKSISGEMQVYKEGESKPSQYRFQIQRPNLYFYQSKESEGFSNGKEVFTRTGKYDITFEKFHTGEQIELPQSLQCFLPFVNAKVKFSSIKNLQEATFSDKQCLSASAGSLIIYCEKDSGMLLGFEDRYGWSPDDGGIRVTFSKLNFNQDIPKSNFDIEIPSGTEPIARNNKIGTDFPDMQLPAFASDQQVNFKQTFQSNKLTLVNFWSYSCMPCRVEFPHLVKLHQLLQSQGLGIVSLSSETRLDMVKRFIKETRCKDIPFPVTYSIKENEVFELCGVAAVPTNFFVNPDGKIVSVSIGWPGEAVLLAHLWKLGFVI